MIHGAAHLLCCLLRQSSDRYGYSSSPYVAYRNIDPEAAERYAEEHNQFLTRKRIGCLRGLGITQILLGIVGISIGIYITMLFYSFHKIDQRTTAGIWGAGITLIASIFTLLLSKNSEKFAKLKPIAIIFNVMATVASAISGLMIYGNYLDSIGFTDVTCQTSKCSSSYHALLLTLLIVLFTGFIIGIMAASYSCLCCCIRKREGAEFVAPAQPISTITVRTEMTPSFNSQILPPPQQQLYYPHANHYNQEQQV